MTSTTDGNEKTIEYPPSSNSPDPTKPEVGQNPTRFSIVYNKPVGSAKNYYDGVAFVDVFGKGLEPHNNGNNYAMVYVCPPFGSNYSSDDEFLTAIQATAENLFTVVRSYNNVAAKNALQPLKVLRLCLYSSNIYNRMPKVPNDKISVAIYNGLLAEIKKDDGGITTLEFPIGHHEFSAVEKLLST